MLNRSTQATRRTWRDAGFTFLEIAVVLAIIGILSAIALPVISRALAGMRLNGAARSISNLTAATKTKAASQFTRARLFVDKSTNSYHIDTWDATVGNWVAVGGTTSLPPGVTFGFGVVAAPPANTQPAINQAAQCLDNALALIGNTACIVFNSRGIPIDDTPPPSPLRGSPTPADALYITDGNLVFGITVSATGLIGVWYTPPLAAPSWTIS
jgi:prepilin-type N-terminal cleavage/methylation domain-containing protein